jgi:hypothetical protein
MNSFKQYLIESVPPQPQTSPKPAWVDRQVYPPVLYPDPNTGRLVPINPEPPFDITDDLESDPDFDPNREWKKWREMMRQQLDHLWLEV